MLSYWGSDLFRMEDKKLAFLGLFAKKADFVTFDSIDLEAKFRSQYKWASSSKLKSPIQIPVIFIFLPIQDPLDIY